MDMLTYLDQSGRTAAGVLHKELVDPNYTLDRLNAAISAMEDLDQIKKCLFYKRQNLVGVEFDAPFTPATYDSPSVDTIHGILGVMTEAGELGEHLRLAMTTGEAVPRAKILDECGDVMWYLAMLFRELGTTFEEVGALNIEKLRIRFPEKFTYETVNNKDHNAEDGVFTK